MRIDLTQATASQIASEPNPKPVSDPQVSGSDLADGEDRTTLSSAPQSLSALVGTAMSSPEIRQDKVDCSDAGHQQRQVPDRPGADCGIDDRRARLGAQRSRLRARGQVDGKLRE